MELLAKAGKEVVEFDGIMPNPTYAKVREGARLACEKNNGAVITKEATKQKNGMMGSFHSFAVLDQAYTLSEMGVEGDGVDEMLRAVADSTIIIPHVPQGPRRCRGLSDSGGVQVARASQTVARAHMPGKPIWRRAS